MRCVDRKLMRSYHRSFYNGYIFATEHVFNIWSRANQDIRWLIRTTEYVEYKDAKFFVARLNNYKNPGSSYLAKELDIAYDELYGVVKREIWLVPPHVTNLVEHKNFLQTAFSQFSWNFVNLCETSEFLFDRAFARACYNINHDDSGVLIPNAERIFIILKTMIDRYVRDGYLVHGIWLLYKDKGKWRKLVTKSA